MRDRINAQTGVVIGRAAAGEQVKKPRRITGNSLIPRSLNLLKPRSFLNTCDVAFSSLALSFHLQDDVSSALFPSGANLNLLVLTVVTASAAAALLVIGLVALCVRRRNKASKMKKADAAEAERGKAQEEYQVRKDVGDFIPRFTARFELYMHYDA